MTGIFIAALPAERPLAERIAERLPMPVTVATSAAAVRRANLLLIVTGAEWPARLDDGPDLRVAVVAALARNDLPVIVLRADDAPLPPVTELPSDLRALPYMPGMAFRSGERFERDLRELSQRITDAIEATATPAIAEAGPSDQRQIPFNVILVVGILLVGVLIIILPDNPLPPPPEDDAADDPGAAPAVAAPDLLIGLGGPLTDPRGQAMLGGVQQALDERPTLTLSGTPFTLDLIAQDTGCSATGGARTAEVFAASPEVVGVVGHLCNVSCGASLDVYAEAGLPVVSPGCEDSTLAGATFFRVVPPDDAAAVAAADLAADLGGAVAVIRDEQPHARRFAPAFMDRFDGTLTGFYPTETGTLDHAEVIATALDDGAEVIYFTGRAPNAAELRRALIEAGRADLPFIAGLQRGEESAFIDAAGDAAEGVYVPQTLDPPTDAAAYEATMRLLDAVETTATSNPIDGPVIDSDALLAALRTYDDVEGQTAVFIVQSGQLTRAGE